MISTCCKGVWKCLTCLSNLKNEFGMNNLLTICGNCNDDSASCMILTTLRLANKEVLFWSNCKFVVTVDEYKNWCFSGLSIKILFYLR